MSADSPKSYFASTAAFLLVILAGLTLAGLYAANKETEGKEAVAQFAEEVTLNGTNALLEANRFLQPECQNLNRKELRLLEFVYPHVNDIAVLDDHNAVICSSSLGVLNQNIPAFTPEYSFTFDGKTIQVTDHSKNVFAGKYPVLTVGRLGRFQVTLSPESVARMDSSIFTALGVIQPDGKLKVIRGTLKTAGEQEEIAELESRKVNWRENSREFNWRHLAVESHYNVKGVEFLYFQRAYIYSLNATSLTFRVGLVLFALMLSLLVHAADIDRRAKHATMLYRIKKLLTAENLRTVYQPIFDLRTQTIVGCEVLVRLQDGNTLRTPDQFLDEVVKRGLTWELDHLVISRSFTELKEVLPVGEPFEISLNLYPQNVKAERLVNLLQQELQWSQKTGPVINLEIIEQEYHDDMLIEIGLLKKAGFSVSVDDFGTGFSNLGSVKKVQPNFLKIDRSFVFDMEEETVRSTLIPEIVAIARATGAAVIAEGIENAKQLDALKALGVEYGQGYHLGKPMSLHAFMERLSLQPRKVVDLTN